MLVARNEDKLKKATRDILDRTKANVSFRAVDVDCVSQVDKAVDEMIAQFGDIDILVNCVSHLPTNHLSPELNKAQAGLALGLPTPFHEQQLEDIVRMNNTNMNGLLFTTQSVIRRAFIKKKSGTILNVTSTTALETPPFPGEVVYHANKAFQEAFSNALRVELSGTDIKVLVLRPGVVNTHFHLQRVMYDSKKYQEIMEGIRPLEPENVAASAVWMLNQPKNVAVKALDVVPNGESIQPLAMIGSVARLTTLPLSATFTCGLRQERQTARKWLPPVSTEKLETFALVYFGISIPQENGSVS